MTPCLNPGMEKELNLSRDERGVAELELLGHGSAQTASGTLLPAGTSPGKAGECKNVWVRKKKKADTQGSLLAGFLQDGAGWCLAGQSGAELAWLHGWQHGRCCVSLKGLSAAGLVPAARRDFTAF